MYEGLKIQKDKNKIEKFKKALEYIYKYCLYTNCQDCFLTCDNGNDCLIKKHGAPVNWYFLEEKHLPDKE